MNGTRRGLNRALLGVFGLVLLAAGALAAWAGASRGFALDWTRTGTQVWAGSQERLAAARIPGLDVSWWTVAVLALLVVAAALLVWWIASQGGGRSNQLAHEDGPAGSTTVDTAVAGQAIKAALADHAQVLSTSVQSWRATPPRGGKGTGEKNKGKNGTGLKISIQARKGASPADLAAAVDHLVDGLDALLGTQIPVLVRIKAGTRTKLARTERVA